MSRRGDNIHKRSDGRWEGRYISGRNEQGKAIYRSVYARNFADCYEKLKLARCDLLPTSKPMIVDELFSVWLQSRKNKVKQSTFVNYRSLYKSYLSERFGAVRVDSLNTFMLDRFVAELLQCGGNHEQGLSPVTVQSIIILLRSILEYGEKEYDLPNAAKNVSLPRSTSQEVTVFDQYEIKRICSSVVTGDCCELGILLALFTGLRIGEICALTWEDIDVSQRLIHVRKTLFRIDNPEQTYPKTVVITDTPKSKHSIRSVPIPTFMYGIISRMKQSRTDNDFFLTCSPHNTEPRTYSMRYRTFLKRLGIPYRSFHALRHTFATECIKSGVDVKTLSELLGHSSVKITLDRYVHSDMELKRQQLEKLYASI